MTHRIFRTVSGYKVVARMDDFFLASARIRKSFEVNGELVDLHLYYKPKKWIAANPMIYGLGFGILFFRRLDQARFFAWSAHEEIWKITARHAYVPEVRCLGDSDELNYFPCVLEGRRFTPLWSRWPSGTWMAQKIKLLERVE